MKIMILVSMAILLAALSGCATPNKTESAVQETSQQVSASSKIMEESLLEDTLSSSESSFSVSVEETNNDGLMESLGFQIDSWVGVPANEYWVIDGKIAEIKFDWDKSNIAYLRIAVAPEENIAGIVGEIYESEKAIDVGEVPVTVQYNMSGPMQAIWEKNGYVFCLYMKKSETEMTEESFGNWIPSYVNDLTLEPTTAPSR